MKIVREYILDLYPTTTFFFVLFVIASVFIMEGYVYPFSLVAVCLVIACLAGKGKTLSNIVIKALIPIVVLIFVLQSLFYPGETILWSWWIFSVKLEGIEFSLMLSSRILAIGSAFILYFSITPIKNFTYALEKMGLSTKATYVILSTMNIIPEMRKMSKTIMDAQRSRGVETEGNLMVRAKAFLPTLSPMILGSIASTEERVITLEARAFTVHGTKTTLQHIEKSKKDNIVRILFVLLILVVIGWRFL
ncbi:energy-coupling factor transporter transmembrane component T [Oceanobacillus jeddahense]|uniref:energy-coupling factor transporter transmembrane component T n=1 Tax=Oceanobacillus jeddahense TaxID=1462527 RepID=UPI0005959576|nr:energy-coupling factor transporter transmembrane component T [Oceanobacillus jeddahense]